MCGLKRSKPDHNLEGRTEAEIREQRRNDLVTCHKFKNATAKSSPPMISKRSLQLPRSHSSTIGTWRSSSRSPRTWLGA